MVGVAVPVGVADGVGWGVLLDVGVLEGVGLEVCVRPR
jgi:hypothetical protein